MTTIAPPSPPTDDAPPAPSRPAWRRAPLGPILGIFVVLCLLLTPFALWVPSRLMGVAASAHMAEIKSTVTAFSLASVPVASMVWSIALYSLFAWRYRGEGAPPETAPPLRENNRLQVVWLVVSSALCMFLLIWGLIVIVPPSQASTAAPMVVNVTGQQWAWSFDYPGDGGVSSSVLYLPVNRPVVFHVTSKDVIHSFWIVAMGVKIDANPGEVTTVSVTPDRAGDFAIRCAELCGLYHAYMQTSAHVVSTEQFNAWLQDPNRSTT